uniref:Hic19 n=1 Tax=Sinohyriopsis cumingii TaxID=165450 RepID=A0A7G3FWG6_SINCU|nr:hic19 [Sinohyriopsis cumingii]
MIFIVALTLVELAATETTSTATPTTSTVQPTTVNTTGQVRTGTEQPCVEFPMKQETGRLIFDLNKDCEMILLLEVPKDSKSTPKKSDQKGFQSRRIKFQPKSDVSGDLKCPELKYKKSGKGKVIMDTFIPDCEMVIERRVKKRGSKGSKSEVQTDKQVNGTTDKPGTTSKPRTESGPKITYRKKKVSERPAA